MTDLNTLREIIEYAIREYSEQKYCARWVYGVETEVLTAVVQNNTKITDYFRTYQLLAMNEMIQQGQWLVYDQENDSVILSRDPIYFQYWNHDWDSVTNGAD
jgi:hypothetical protein